jgi:hypothetical protein
LVVCNNSEGTLTATPIGGGDSPYYQWFAYNGFNTYQVDETSASLTLYANDFTPVYSCGVMSDEICADRYPSLPVSVTYQFEPTVVPSVDLSVSTFLPCTNDSVVYVATPVNGGDNPSYLWLVDGVAVLGDSDNTHAFYVDSDNSMISCQLISDAQCPSQDTISSGEIPLTFYDLPNVTVNQNGNTLSGVPAAGNTYQWANCTPFYTLSWANTINFTPTESGSYALIVNGLYCADTSACVTVTIVPDNVEEMDFFELEVYPNPADEWIQLSSDVASGPVTVDILSSQGQLLRSQRLQLSTAQTLDLRSLAAGLYFLKVTNGSQISLKRLVVE